MDDFEFDEVDLLCELGGVDEKSLSASICPSVSTTDTPAVPVLSSVAVARGDSYQRSCVVYPSVGADTPVNAAAHVSAVLDHRVGRKKAIPGPAGNLPSISHEKRAQLIKMRRRAPLVEIQRFLGLAPPLSFSSSSIPTPHDPRSVEVSTSVLSQLSDRACKVQRISRATTATVKSIDSSNNIIILRDVEGGEMNACVVDKSMLVDGAISEGSQVQLKGCAILRHGHLAPCLIIANPIQTPPRQSTSNTLASIQQQMEPPDKTSSNDQQQQLDLLDIDMTIFDDDDY